MTALLELYCGVHDWNKVIALSKRMEGLLVTFWKDIFDLVALLVAQKISFLVAIPLLLYHLTNMHFCNLFATF